MKYIHLTTKIKAHISYKIHAFKRMFPILRIAKIKARISYKIHAFANKNSLNPHPHLKHISTISGIPAENSIQTARE